MADERAAKRVAPTRGAPTLAGRNPKQVANQLRALTVYLLIPEIIDPLDALCEPRPDFDVLHVVPDDEWVLCIRNRKGERPDWAKFFDGVAGFNINKVGPTSSVSALLLVPSGGKLWALTFGHGRSLLREGIVEDRFGLRTALNAIDPDKVRAIDKETFDSLASQARQQAVDDTELENFGINVERDLLYAVAGVPSDKKRLGRRLYGKDALCCSTRKSITEIPGYLELLDEYYKSKRYSEDRRFAWVDNIYEVRDKADRRNLDARLVEKLQKQELINAWLALPETIDWQRAQGFGYVNPTTNFVVDDLYLQYFLDAFRNKNRTLDVVALKRSKVVCLDHDGEDIQRWSVYQCLYAEIETEKGDIYLLTNGHWYKLNKDIVIDVNEWYDKLNIDDTLMPPMKLREIEDAYNDRIGKLQQYTIFHKQPVYLPGNRGPIEFCDLAMFGENQRDLIHVKRFGRSSKLSHLFYQGMNSARLFRCSPEFRKCLSATIEGDSEVARKLAKEPEAREYRVVFAIASSSTSKLHLPLFSRLALKQAISELDGLGFRTAVAKIEVPQDERGLKKEKKKKGKSVRRAWDDDPKKGLSTPLPETIDQPALTAPIISPTQSLDIPTELEWESGPFAHQGAAVHAWESNNRRGILAIATGGGKTTSGLICATRLQNADNRPLLVLVLVPSDPLLDQWYSETERFGLRPHVLSRLAAPERIPDLHGIVAGLVHGVARTQVLISSNQLFVSSKPLRAFFRDLPKEIRVLLIADEVHNLGTRSFLADPPITIPHRLGLSATPIRQYDADGTAELFRFFGETAFEFDLGHAIAAGCLTPYNYHLHEVHLADEEMDLWIEITERLRKRGFTAEDKGQTGGLDNAVQRLLVRRRAILENAEAKIATLQKLLTDRPPSAVERTLIYTSAKNDPLARGRQITRVNQLLNELGIISHQLTYSETGGPRARQILADFAAGLYQTLTCMKVLDEGVDVPATSTAYLLASSTVSREWVQRRGRVLRKAPGKHLANLHDFFVVPPNPNERNGRSIIRSELARADEFCRLAENAWDNDGPRAVTERYS